MPVVGLTGTSSRPVGLSAAGSLRMALAVPTCGASEEAVMRAMLCLALSLSCAACATSPPPPAAVAIPQSAAFVPAPQSCRDYTTPVLVGGKSETASGVACEQAD